MKKRWKIIAGILCITLMGTACSKKTINDGEEQQTTVDKTGKEMRIRVNLMCSAQLHIPMLRI